MGADAFEAGYINGQKNDTDLECTSEDLDIGFAEVSAFRLDTKTGPGGYTPLPAGSSIPCTVGQTVYVITAAILENNAQDRYDIGVWINESGGSALGPGGSCLHFNLINGQNGSSDVDGDQCGDMSQGVTATVPLDTLQVVCQDNPGIPGQQVAVGACVGFQHQEGGDDRVCPTGTAPGGGSGFRLLTTPGTTAKCKCEPLILPLDIKAVLRIVKQTSPDADPQSFEFNPSYSGTNFFLTDGQTNVSGPLNAGTHTVDEIVPTGWILGTRTCVNTTGGTPHDFTSTTNGISVDLAPAEDVTCTFNNTKRATLVVRKITLGDVGTFNFTSTGGLPSPADGSGNFSITTVAQNTAVSATFSNLVPGSFSVTETVPAGWDLTNRTCVETVAGAGGSTFPGSGTSATASVTLAAGATITCTYTNRKKATLVIRKITQGDVGTFNFTSTGGLPSPADGSGNFAITTVAQNTAVSATFNNLTPGAFSVTETVPSGWSLADRTCVETVAGAGGSTFPGSGTSATASVTLAAGATITCTYTNTRGATLVVRKITQGDVGTFNFSSTGGLPSPADGSGNFALTTVAQNTAVSATFTNLAAGAYSVTETVPAGWDLTDRTCVETAAGAGGSTFPGSGTSPTASVTLASGATITCTYTNRKKANLVIRKITVGGVGAFNYTSTGGLPSPADGSGNFAITTVAQNTAVSATFNNLTPGAFSVTETVPAGWDLTNRTCVETVAGAGGSTFPGSGTSPTASVTLAAGATITCTYTNRKKAILVVRKITQGDVGTFNFTSTGGLPSPADGSGNFAITTVAQNTAVSATFNDLTPGAFSVTETVPSGWALTARTCVETVAGAGGSTFPASGTTQPANITLAAGATITCTYTNTKGASLVIRKITQGGVGAFNFTSTGGLPSPADGSGNFAITTVAQNTAVSATFSNLTPGAFSVTETVPSGWDLTDRTCVETVAGAGGSTFPGSGTSATASVTIAAGATITCTYTNRKKASLVIRKITEGGVGTFNFTSTGGLPSPADGSGNFALTTVAPNTAVSATFNNLTPGAFSVTETIPTGWALDSRVCVETVAGAGGSVFPASGTTQPANITLAAGATITCTFTNEVVGRGQIAPTAVTCSQFAAGEAPVLAELLASMKVGGSVINTISPGVFFYYAEVTKGAGQSIGFTQTITSNNGGLPLYDVHQAQAYIYSVSGDICSSPLETLTLSGSGGSGGSALPAGNYIIGVKFTPDAAKGLNVGNALDPLAVHQYEVTINGVLSGSQASVTTRRK